MSLVYGIGRRTIDQSEAQQWLRVRRILAQVELRGVSKVYSGGVEAVSAVDLVIGDGERLAIVGPSGSGKSTLLRLIAGLESLSAGSLWIGGARADGLPPPERDVAMVFQNPALYPHLSVFGNLAFGLRARGRPGDEVRTRVEAVAAQLGLTGLLARRPRTLSGGERQRVALGRAIVRGPAVFLLDEPFSSLDTPLRAALRAELLDLHRSLRTTMILVTHDQSEALALGERVGVMDRGRVVQVAPPLEVYDRPAHRFVGQFIGDPSMSLIPCALADGPAGRRLQPVAMPEAAGWPVDGLAWAARLLETTTGRIDLGLRPEHVAVVGTDPASPGSLHAEVEVRRLEPRGHETLATLGFGPYQIATRLPARSPVGVGERVTVRLDASRAAWFDSETGAALCSDKR